MTTSDWVRGALAWLATYGLHSTLFLGGAWLVCVLRAPKANRNRERVWKLALVGGLLSSTLQLALGARPLLGRIDWRTTEVPAVATSDAALAGAEVSREEQRSAAPTAMSEAAAPRPAPALPAAAGGAESRARDSAASRRSEGEPRVECTQTWELEVAAL